MKGFLQTTGIAGCGLATSLFTAIIVLFISRLFSVDIFTFSVWVIIPVGAIFTGVAAASGYYFGSLYFHQRPTKLLFF